MTAVEVLAQLTPSQVTESLEDLERKFAAQQDHYFRQKKLLTMILKGLGVKQSKFRASAAENRELRREAVLKLVGELKKADAQTIVQRCGLPHQGAALMLKSLVAKNKLKQLKTGEYDRGAATITVRLPFRCHQALVAQAHDLRISLNQLAVSRLVSAVPKCEIVPMQTKDRLRREALLRQDPAAKEKENPRA